MLSVRNVSFAYNKEPVLNGISLEVAEGEIVGLVGPNGAGKSTLLRLISGVLCPESGTVTLNGADLVSMDTKCRARQVAVVPQEPTLPTGFTVVDFVLMGRHSHLGLLGWEGERDLEVAAYVMELTRVRHLAHRRLDTLSGGERRRVVIATALAQEAPVLLLDEPTSNLDLTHQMGVMGLVGDLRRRRGRTVLAAIHDLTLAAQYCDRLVMLVEGRNHAEGPPDEVLVPRTLSAVYGIGVSILPHPATGTPVVLPISRVDKSTRSS